MFEGMDFLRFANDCRVKMTGEAASRSVISRAYYAAYLTARAACDRNGEVGISQYSAHADIGSRISRVDRLLGADLRDLRTLRNDADYKAQYSRLDDDVQEALDLAQGLVQRLSTARWTP